MRVVDLCKVQVKPTQTKWLKTKHKTVLGNVLVEQTIQVTSAKIVALKNQQPKADGPAHVEQPTQVTSAKTVALKNQLQTQNSALTVAHKIQATSVQIAEVRYNDGVVILVVSMRQSRSYDCLRQVMVASQVMNTFGML